MPSMTLRVRHLAVALVGSIAVSGLLFAGPASALSGAAGSGNAAVAQYASPNAGVGPDQASSPPKSAVKSPQQEHRSGTEVPAQQAAAAAHGSLPFTGFDIAIVALAGLALIGGGMVLRRRLPSSSQSV